MSAAAAPMTRAECVGRLAELRDEFVRTSTRGRFHDAASREWRELAPTWRMALVLMAGVGDDSQDVARLAERPWSEFAPGEREQIKALARSAKGSFARVAALAARI